MFSSSCATSSGVNRLQPCLSVAHGSKLKAGRKRQRRMRYWGWFAAKLAVAAGVFRGLLALISWMFPPDKDPLAPLNKGASYLLCDLALMLCFLLAAGTLYLIIWDQRYRCRVCLRRLRMPIET